MKDRIKHIEKIIEGIIARLRDGEMVVLLIVHHNDLDGEAANIVINHLMKTTFSHQYPNLKIKSITCKKDANEIIDILDMNKKCMIGEGLIITDILIYDLSISEEVAEELENREELKSIVMIDHHKSAMEHAIKPWQLVIAHDETSFIRACSASELTFHYYISKLFNIYNNDTYEYCVQFLSLVSIYDTYAWNNDNFNKGYMEFVSNNDIFGKVITDEDNEEIYKTKGIAGISDCANKLNIFFKSVTLDKFTEHVERWMHSLNLLIDDKVNLVYDIGNQNIEKVIDTIRDNYRLFKIYRNGETLLALTCFTSIYQSEIGKFFYEKYNDIDIVFMIDMNRQSVSMRTKKDNIDLSAIAKSLNGGGHPKAAGFPFDPNLVFTVENILELLGTIIQ